MAFTYTTSDVYNSVTMSYYNQSLHSSHDNATLLLMLLLRPSLSKALHMNQLMSLTCLRHFHAIIHLSSMLTNMPPLVI